MLESHLKYISDRQSADLLGSAERITFKDLIATSLPPYLWDYLNVVLNPHLGGTVQIGNITIDFADEDVISGLEGRLMEELVFDEESLQDIVNSALNTRLQYIIDPALTMAQLIFVRQPRQDIPSQDVRAALEGLVKVVQHWNVRITRSIGVIVEYLLQQPKLTLSQADLSRQLRAAIEKDFTQSPFSSIEASLLIIKELMQPASGVSSLEELDYTDLVSQLLNSRGLTSWTPAVDVERELTDKPLDIDDILKALCRLRFYREHGILRMEQEDQQAVEEEVASFTGFIEEVS